MITEQQIYWLTRLDNILVALGLFAIGAAIVAAGIGLIGLMELVNDGRCATLILRKSARLFCAVIISVIVMAFIPSTKEVAAIIVLPKIVNNEKVQDAGNKLFDLAVEWLEDLKREKNKEGK